MIKTYQELLIENQKYSNAKTKIQRLVKNEKIFLISKGLYETNNKVDPYYLAGAILSPSYISFQSALSIYGLIPERVYAITSASFNKRKTKEYNTQFGNYIYKDVPKDVFYYEVLDKSKDGYSYFIASREKALTDMLYLYSPVYSVKQLKEILFEDLRIDEIEFDNLDFGVIIELCEKYKTTNHRLMIKFLRGIKNAK